MTNLRLLHARLHASLVAGVALLDRRRDERGDVPGWVMITVMTVGIVVALQLFVGPELESMMRRALGRVSN